MELKVLERLAIGQRGSFARLNKQMCFVNGYNKPRYFDRQGKAGLLGLSEWTDSSYQLTAVLNDAGSLPEGKYYSCVAVPVDTRYPDSLGNFRRGTPTSPSTAVLTTSTKKSITFTLPLAHPQRSLNVYTPAFLTGGTNTQSNPSVWKSITNGRFGITIDGVLRNVSIDFSGVSTMTDVAQKIQNAIRALTEKYENVVWDTNRFVFYSSSTDSNSSIGYTVYYGGGTSIYGSGWIDGASGSATITEKSLSYEADKVWLYCSQGQSSALLAENSAKYFIGIVDNVAGATFTLSEDVATANDAVEFDNLPPPTFSHIIALQNRIWGICGTREARGQVKWSSSDSKFIGKTYGSYTISSITSLGNDIFRLTFSGSPDLSEITTGYRATVSGCSVSGNNVILAPIVAVGSNYIDIRNEKGSSSGTFGSAVIYTTFFEDGFEGMTFRFENDGVNQIYHIKSVDVDNQAFIVEEDGYNGVIPADTFSNFFIENFDRTLWFSKADDPNSYPSENTLQFEEDLTALAAGGEYLVVFSRESVFIVNPRVPSEFRKSNSPIGTNAPYSVISAENGVYFYDGKTIRIFDGLQSVDITRRKVRQVLERVNKAVADRITAVYIPTEQSIRWYLPLDNSVVNNYYVQYNVNTGFWWIGQCIDCTCATVLKDETTGEEFLYTGSSARYSNIGFINKYIPKRYLDGVSDSTTYYFGVVDFIDDDNKTLTVYSSGMAISENEIGVPFYVFAGNGVRDLTGVVRTIVDNGGGYYTITYHNDFNLSSAQIGDMFAIGVIPFIWGIKWLDFGSPQYKHELKEVHLHFSPTSYIYGIVDFYTDFSDTPDKSVSFVVNQNETKVVVRNHGKRGYQVGFRIRAWSYDIIEIRDIVVIHKTIV